MSPLHFDILLEELYERSVVRLLTAETYDNAAFVELKRCLCEKAELLKNDYVVPKQVIRVLFEAANAIETRAAYVQSARENLGLATEMRMLVELIAKGEGCNDRIPGVPRIV